MFPQYYEKLLNTPNINKLEFEYISADYKHASLTFEELDKVLELTKNIRFFCPYIMNVG